MRDGSGSLGNVQEGVAAGMAVVLDMDAVSAAVPGGVLRKPSRSGLEAVDGSIDGVLVLTGRERKVESVTAMTTHHAGDRSCELWGGAWDTTSID